MCLSSPTYCNCSFTIECLNNSLQILCIYAELLNSAVCCSFFFLFFFLVLLVFPMAVRPLLLLHIDLPAPLSSALLTTSLLLYIWQNQKGCAETPLCRLQLLVPPFIYALLQKRGQGVSRETSHQQPAALCSADCWV